MSGSARQRAESSRVTVGPRAVGAAARPVPAQPWSAAPPCLACSPPPGSPHADRLAGVLTGFDVHRHRWQGGSPVVGHELVRPGRRPDLLSGCELGHVRLDVEDGGAVDSIQRPHREREAVDREQARNRDADPVGGPWPAGRRSRPSATPGCLWGGGRRLGHCRDRRGRRGR
jgi:hypothetical protein